jgi:adenylate cyclase
VDHGRTYVDVVIEGEDRTFDLTEIASLSIGRHPQCTVVLTDDPNVSRKHALLQREGSGEYYLSDLGSRNGTSRNGLPVTAPVPLRDGDSFIVGSHRFVFHQTTPRVEEDEALQDPTDVLVVERMLTILVLDIRNYTGLARELGESRITEVMNRLFHESGQLLKRNGSWAQKYIGDAVMSIWVHEGEGTTPREVSLLFKSLAELADVIGRLNVELALPRPLAFGAGVNSGLAVTGNMGSAGLADHTAMGDAVNKAFRLETASKEIGREVVLGAPTFALLPEGARSLFATHTVHLKGYDAQEDVYALTLADLPRLLDALSH